MPIYVVFRRHTERLRRAAWHRPTRPRFALCLIENVHQNHYAALTHTKREISRPITVATDVMQLLQQLAQLIELLHPDRSGAAQTQCSGGATSIEQLRWCVKRLAY